MPISTIILLILGAVCLLGAVLAMRYAMTYDKPKRRKTPEISTPLPGSEGGGVYRMRVAEIPDYKARARLEDALNAIPGIRAEADFNTCEVMIRYKGFPDLDLLDKLRLTAERAGFQVTEIG